MTTSTNGHASLSGLEEEAADCTQCRLHQGRTQVVFGVGNPQADLMFVGEAPGRDEDLQGEPFVGRAGVLLTGLIEAMGLTRQDVYLTTIIKCRPPNNRNPEAEELASCAPYLSRQIALVHPRVIVALGTWGAQTLLQTPLPITHLRGRFHPYQGVQVMPTFHPAFLLRNPERRRAVIDDLQLVQGALGLSSSPEAWDVIMTEPPAVAPDLTPRLLEAASTKALGWVLEQFCQLHWTDSGLDIYFVGQHAIAHELLHEDDTLRTLQDLVRRVVGRPMAVHMIDAPSAPEAPPPAPAVPVLPALPSLPPVSEVPAPSVTNQGLIFTQDQPVLEWNGLRFRSRSEVRIAEALDRARVLFWPNGRARLGLEDRHTREADFLVCQHGRWGVLEVDGEPFHPASRTVEDHARDRLFKAHGLWVVEHFDAAECFRDPDRVVRQFLALLAR